MSDLPAWQNPNAFAKPELYWRNRLAVLEYMIRTPIFCRKYGKQQVAEWLKECRTFKANLEPVVYPQGSQERGSL